MEKLITYRRVIRELLQRYATYRPAKGNIETQVLFDEANDHYALVYVGWDGPHRIHAMIVHIDICNDKVWIQHDGTNAVVAEELVEAGIPRDQIVLGFREPEIRQYTDYAVA